MHPILSTAHEWCAWAQAERRAGQPENAAKGFRQALVLDASSSAAAFGLASVLLDSGRVAEAVEIASSMAAAAADRQDVLWLLIRIAQIDSETQTMRDLLERLLAGAALSAAQRAEALLMLGIALNDLGDNVGAFDAAKRAKRIQRTLYAPTAAGREGEIAKLNRLRSWIATAPTDWEISPSLQKTGAAASHVFLVGFPRSGTTLLEQVLGAHPRVQTLEEAPTLATAYQAFLSDLSACGELLNLASEEAEAWSEHYWADIRKAGIQVGGKVFVDKQPAGTVNLPIIAKLFPRAKILFALRDPRDVVLSCFRQAFGINAMTYTFTDLTETARCYDACMSFAAEAQAVLPLAWLDVRHETLVEDFSDEVRRILRFLDLEPDPGCWDFARHAATRAILTPSATQVRAGLNQRGLGRWKAYREDLAPVLPILAPWIERFGYRV